MMKRAGSAALFAVGVLLVVVAVAENASAQTGFSDPDPLTLRAAMKWTSLLSRAPADSVLFPERWSGTSLWRIRLTAVARPVRNVRIEAAYEQRLNVASGDPGLFGASSFLQTGSPPPYRIEPLEDEIVETDGSLAYHHELDRALVSFPLGEVDVTLGRQAVGWGRGVLFSAVDIFAPFTPLESDREWRRGIDAVRVTAPVTDAVSVEGIAAAGESIDESAFAARAFGYVGGLDAELVAGRRFEDLFGGVSASFHVLDAELHGESAVFRTSEPVGEEGIFGVDDVVLKAVAGGSYSFDVGDGLYLLGEYHYSGFGVAETDELSYWLLADAFVSRVLRGDTQILGRHAAALRATYGLGTTLSWSLLAVSNPSDGSGVVAPGFTWTAGDRVTLSGTLYLPYGATSDAGRIQSEYGSTLRTALLTLGFYP